MCFQFVTHPVSQSALFLFWLIPQKYSFLQKIIFCCCILSMFTYFKLWLAVFLYVNFLIFKKYFWLSINSVLWTACSCFDKYIWCILNIPCFCPVTSAMPCKIHFYHLQNNIFNRVDLAYDTWLIYLYNNLNKNSTSLTFIVIKSSFSIHRKYYFSI